MPDQQHQPRVIQFCITELDPGGAERGLVSIVTRLDRKFWQPHVVCLAGPGELVKTLEAAGIPVTCLGARHRGQLTVLWKLYREIRRVQPELLQTFLFHANILGRVAARLAGVKKVVSGIRVAERRSRWYLRLDRWTEFLVQRHVCVSQDVLEFSRNIAGLSADKLISIPNGVDVERFSTAVPVPRSQLECTDQDQIVLFVGRLNQQKGLLDLLPAAEQLKPAYPKLKWLLVGEGEQRAGLEAEILSRQLSEQVRLLGYRQDIPRLMKTADLFVLPSHWEGMPNVILEAMAAGLPVVSTAVEGIAELLEQGNFGTVVPPQSPVQLAEAVARLLQQPELRRQVADRAFQHVSQNFSWEASVCRYDQLYRQLLALNDSCEKNSPADSGSGL